MQTVIEKIGVKSMQKDMAATSSMDSLKSSIDYLTHYLMTLNLNEMKNDVKKKDEAPNTENIPEVQKKNTQPVTQRSLKK